MWRSRRLQSISVGDSFCPEERVPRRKLILPKGFSGRLKGWLAAALPALVYFSFYLSNCSWWWAFFYVFINCISSCSVPQLYLWRSKCFLLWVWINFIHETYPRLAYLLQISLNPLHSLPFHFFMQKVNTLYLTIFLWFLPLLLGLHDPLEKSENYPSLGWPCVCVCVSERMCSCIFKMFNSLIQGWANFFCKGSDTICFPPGKPQGLCPDRGCVPVRLYSQKHLADRFGPEAGICQKPCLSKNNLCWGIVWGKVLKL